RSHDGRARTQRLGVEGAMPLLGGHRALALVEHLDVATERKSPDHELGLLPRMLTPGLPAQEGLAEADREALHLDAAGHRDAVMAVFVDRDEDAEGDHK